MIILPFSSYQSISFCFSWFRFAFVGFVLFRFHFVDFVSFRFVFVDFVSFRFASFSLISFGFVSFRFYFVSHFIGTPFFLQNSLWNIQRFNHNIQGISNSITYRGRIHTCTNYNIIKYKDEIFEPYKYNTSLQVLVVAACGADVFALSRTQSDLDSLKGQVWWHLIILIYSQTCIKISPFRIRKNDLIRQVTS